MRATGLELRLVTNGERRNKWIKRVLSHNNGSNGHGVSTRNIQPIAVDAPDDGLFILVCSKASSVTQQVTAGATCRQK